MCEILNVSRSGYYKYLKNPERKSYFREKEILEKIILSYQNSRGIYGSPRITEDLKNKGYVLSKSKIARIMKMNKIYSKIRQKYKPITMIRDSKATASPNLLNQNFKIENLNQAWTSDITYIPTKEGWLYLAVIIDLCSRNPIGWAMETNMKTDLIIKALNHAMKSRGLSSAKNEIIFHSDQGSQYRSSDFRKILKSKNFIQSMSRKGNCYDNAVAESFFHSLKTEHTQHLKFETIEEAKAEIFNYIEIFYKRKRLHSFLNYMTPIAFEFSIIN
jgi:putative transposase